MDMQEAGDERNIRLYEQCRGEEAYTTKYRIHVEDDKTEKNNTRIYLYSGDGTGKCKQGEACSLNALGRSGAVEKGKTKQEKDREKKNSPDEKHARSGSTLGARGVPALAATTRVIAVAPAVTRSACTALDWAGPSAPGAL
jgi:hypothetical protein